MVCVSKGIACWETVRRVLNDIKVDFTWWRHQMEIFSALLAICAGNSPVSGEFPAQRPVTRSFDVFFDVRLIKRLSKHSRGWWFETLSHPLWRHHNEHMLSSVPSLYGITRRLATTLWLKFIGMDSFYVSSYIDNGAHQRHGVLNSR